MEKDLFEQVTPKKNGKTRAAKPTGSIIFSGPSLIDGKPIVVIAIYHSQNIKTGDMVQTFILREDIDPVTANRSGEDFSICGNCKLKGEPTDNPNAQSAKGRACYVVVRQAPLTIWKGYQAGKYPVANGHDELAAIGKGRKVRLGAYGDPSAVPSYIWDSLISEASGYTGYSHFNDLGNVDFRPDLYMFSADTLEEAQEAWKKGWRTFRVAKELSEITEGEILCPAHDLANRRAKCVTCGLCGGANVEGKNIVNVVHGYGKRYFIG